MRPVLAVLLACSSALLCLAADEDSQWRILGGIAPGSPLWVVPKDKADKPVRAGFVSCTADTLVVSMPTAATREFRRPEVASVSLLQKRSRAKGALIGGLVGFGAGVPLGALAAAYGGAITGSANTPYARGIGIVGAITAGIGAGIGAALSFGEKKVRLYHAK